MDHNANEGHKGEAVPNLTAWLDLVGALTTVVLVLLTGWYAFTTRKMAKSAMDSAESSRAAADASLRAARVAEAQVPIEFSVRPKAGSLNDGPTIILGFQVRCDGATVF